MADHETILETGTSHIDISILEPNVFRDLKLILNHKRGGIGSVQDFEFGNQDIDFPGHQFGVDHTLRSVYHSSPYGQNILVSDGLGFVVNSLVELGIEDHLGEAFPVPQVDENDPAMISSTLYPAHEYHFFIHISGGKLAAVVGSLHLTQRISQDKLLSLLPFDKRGLPSFVLVTAVYAVDQAGNQI
jgi:hypothetical protein